MVRTFLSLSLSVPPPFTPASNKKNPETSSSISDTEAPNETLAERLLALRDIVPPTRRAQIAQTGGVAYDWGSWGVLKGLKMAYVVSVSVLLLVAPFSLVAMEDAAIAAEERLAMQQQSAGEIIAPEKAM